MTCPRTAAHEETELLSVLKIPFRQTTPYWALVGFTGLRTAELERLDWAEVHFDF